MNIKKLAAIVLSLTVISTGSVLAYYQSPQTASARNYQLGSVGGQTVTTIGPAGPVTYHQGYRVMPDGSTQPVIIHHGYVVDQQGAVEMTVQPIYHPDVADSQKNRQVKYGGENDSCKR